MTTNNPAPEQPTGKTFDAVNSFVTMVQSHTRCSSMKAHTAWMPAILYPNGKGGYVVLNVNGFRIGENKHIRISKDWVVDADDLDLSHVNPDEGGIIDLFGIGYPWETEDYKNHYLGSITKIFRVPPRKLNMPSHMRMLVGG